MIEKYRMNGGKSHQDIKLNVVEMRLLRRKSGYTTQDRNRYEITRESWSNIYWWFGHM